MHLGEYSDYALPTEHPSPRYRLRMCSQYNPQGSDLGDHMDIRVQALLVPSVLVQCLMHMKKIPRLYQRVRYHTC